MNEAETNLKANSKLSPKAVENFTELFENGINRFVYFKLKNTLTNYMKP